MVVGSHQRQVAFLIRPVSLALLSFTDFVSIFLYFPQYPTHYGFSPFTGKPFNAGSQNLAETFIWMISRSTVKVRVIGQRSGSPGQYRLLGQCTIHVVRCTGHRQHLLANVTLNAIYRCPVLSMLFDLNKSSEINCFLNQKEIIHSYYLLLLFIYFSKYISKEHQLKIYIIVFTIQWPILCKYM